MPLALILRAHTTVPVILNTSGMVSTVKVRLASTMPLRAFLHGGRGPQVGEVTRLAVVEKKNAFTCTLITPGCWGDVS